MSPRTEKPITTQSFDSSREALHHLARELCGLIRMKAFQRGTAVLGLPAGETLDELYAETLRMSGVQGKGGLDYAKVHAVCLSELAGCTPSMRDRLWKAFAEPAGIPESQLHGIEQIEEASKLSVAVVRLGPDGELELNEPGAPEDAPTRTVTLTPAMLEQLARDLPDLESLPPEALTVGPATLRAAERVRVLALGVDSTPPELLRGHKDCQVLAVR